MIYSCGVKEEQNPFLADFQTENGVPPFDEIKMEHYEPAFLKGIEEQNKNIEEIIDSKEPPTFSNVIERLDNSSPILDRVGGVFYNLTSAETTEELTNLSLKLSPILTEQNDNIYLNQALFDKVNAVYQNREKEELTTEQLRLLEKVYQGFIRAGAKLPAGAQQRLREINTQLSTLALTFGHNILNEDNSYKLLIDNEADLAGLPTSYIQSAKEEAKLIGEEGKWLVTLHNSSRLPFLQYAENRDLRKELFSAYINRGNNQNENNNKEVITEIVKLRLEKAQLLGYTNFADFVLARNMAKDSETVMNFLHKLWDYSLPAAKKEADELEQLLKEELPGESLEAWDWWFYTEKLRQSKYALNEEEIKPYFKLENVRDGAFTVANKLYGISITKIEGVPVYHPDVEVFEVKDRDGSQLGLFYVDYFPRAGKRSGAWMSSYRDQKGEIRPLICNVCNFTKPTADLPSLLTLDEVETLFHEFGHALHGLLTKCNYAGVSGTSVSRDFVELPSQINEHWAMEPEVLKMYAKHYQTNEVISDELIEKIIKQSTFNEGFRTTELLAAAILDMNLHVLTTADDLDVVSYEKEAMDKLGLIKQIPPRYRTTYFNHIVGGYAAGYYSYLWANVLDSDAFEAFKENGIFDQETADLFRRNVLEKGDSEDPMILYKNFRGKEPQLEPMLKNRGLI